MEEWRDIEGFGNRFQISNLGRVRSNAWGKNSILKQSITTNGYLRIHVNYKHHHKYLLVHRLVAEAFIPNPGNLPQVNHKNEDKTDNRVENLEWCDAKYNSNYGTGRARCEKKKRKPVIQMSIDCEELCYWFSKKWAAENTGTNIGNINRCLFGNGITAGGYKWKLP